MSDRNVRHKPHLSIEDLLPPRGTSPVVLLWRWRTEIVSFAAAAGAAVVLATAAAQGWWLAFLALAGSVSVPATVPAGRKWLSRHFWCVFSRHRLQRVCMETPMHTRKGRIPLVLWITPTALGEKAFLLLRAGISAADFEAFGPEIAAACYATSVRVSRHPRRAQFVTVEIVRRGEVLGAAAFSGEHPHEMRVRPAPAPAPQ
ncbi:hypothetical protein [Nonomuraea basaltis]|uniref:hypothetical protein n=1 Tax=Nonomuraea basaltis TaxID=2495887 RepID=UPI00110C4F25|nr:hypothetical protein [Nonomuraea basaltis]TMR90558.1 hypothetical protein EJK15_54675 [Nonomuraea basaltis]